MLMGLFAFRSRTWVRGLVVVAAASLGGGLTPRSISARETATGSVTSLSEGFVLEREAVLTHVRMREMLGLDGRR